MCSPMPDDADLTEDDIAGLYPHNTNHLHFANMDIDNGIPVYDLHSGPWQECYECT